MESLKFDMVAPIKSSTFAYDEVNPVERVQIAEVSERMRHCFNYLSVLDHVDIFIS
jgi:hypothetical protein